MERRSSRRRRSYDGSFARRILWVLGTVLLVSTVFVVARGPWLAEVLSAVPKEEEWTRPSAMLFAGAVALASLTAAAYLSLEEWRRARHHRDKKNEQ